MPTNPTNESASKDLGRAAFSAMRLLVLAVVVGAVLAVVTKGIFQAVLWIIDVLWDWLPGEIGVDPDSWWFVVTILGVGGLLVGLGNRFLGYHPRPLEEVTEDLKDGKPIPHRSIPASLANSAASLGFGGPLGPEALLVSVVGGLYYWVDVRMQGLARSVFSSLTGRNEDAAGKPWQYSPTLITAVSVIVVFRELPGGIDLSFVPIPKEPAALSAIVMAAGAGLVGGLVGLFSSRLHSWARGLGLFTRSPEIVGIMGGLLVALLAVGGFEVLFSGAEEVTKLFDGSLDVPNMAYVGAAKWLALAIVMAAGWKGGPIFPLMFCMGALGVVAGESLGLESAILYAGAIAGVVTGALGSIALGVLVALLVVPPALLVPMIVGGATAGLALRLGQPTESKVTTAG